MAGPQSHRCNGVYRKRFNRWSGRNLRRAWEHYDNIGQMKLSFNSESYCFAIADDIVYGPFKNGGKYEPDRLFRSNRMTLLPYVNCWLLRDITKHR